MGIPPIEEGDLAKMLDGSVRSKGYVPVQHGHQLWYRLSEGFIGKSYRHIAKCSAIYLGKKQARKITMVNVPEEKLMIPA